MRKIEDITNFKKFPNEIEVAKEIIRKNAGYIKYAPNKIRLNEQIVKLALSIDIQVFPSISHKYTRLRSFVMEYIERDVRIYKHWIVNNLKNDESVARKFIEHHAAHFSFLPDHLKNKKEFVKLAISLGATIHLREIINEDIRDDEEIVKNIIEKDIDSLRYASHRLKNEKKFMRDAIDINVLAFKYAPYSLKSDEEVVKKVLRENGTLLQYASDELRSDKSIIMIALNCPFPVTKYVCKREILVDKDIVFLAVRNCPRNVRYMPKGLSKYKDIARIAMKLDGSVFDWFNYDIRNDYDILMEAIKTHPNAFLYASIGLRGQKDIASYAVRLDGYNMSVVPSSVKIDRDVILEALKTYPLVLGYVNIENYDYGRDYDLLLKSLEYSSRNYKYAPMSIQVREDFVWNALLENLDMFQYIPWYCWCSRKEFLWKLILMHNKNTINDQGTEKLKILKKTIHCGISRDKELQCLEHGYHTVPRHITKLNDIFFSFGHVERSIKTIPKRKWGNLECDDIIMNNKTKKIKK